MVDADSMTENNALQEPRELLINKSRPALSVFESEVKGEY